MIGMLLFGGCGPEEPPSLLAELDGDWVGEVGTPSGRWDVDASFAWDEAEQVLSGRFVVHEDPEDRAYVLLDAVSVDDLGVSLVGIQEGGVHELYVDALAPLDPFEALWRTRWFCAGSPDGYCHDDGSLAMERR